jgi:hypothetical protein
MALGNCHRNAGRMRRDRHGTVKFHHDVPLVELYPCGLHHTRQIQTWGPQSAAERTGPVENYGKTRHESYDTIQIRTALLRQGSSRITPPRATGSMHCLPLEAAWNGSSTATTCSCLTLPRPFQFLVSLDLLSLIPVRHATPMSSQLRTLRKFSNNEEELQRIIHSMFTAYLLLMINLSLTL